MHSCTHVYIRICAHAHTCIRMSVCTGILLYHCIALLCIRICAYYTYVGVHRHTPHAHTCIRMSVCTGVLLYHCIALLCIRICAYYTYVGVHRHTLQTYYRVACSKKCRWVADQFPQICPQTSDILAKNNSRGDLESEQGFVDLGSLT
jgi:hypothetical protein